MTFQSLGLSASFERAAQQRGYLGPTPIQAAAIPPALEGRDVQGTARTGSGKTQAFGWPVLQRLSDAGVPAQGQPRPVRALILAPTRELTAQIGDSLREDAQHLPVALKIAITYGGVSINPQMMRLRGGADIVVATPGRLLDLVDQNAVSIADVRTLVLDEADKLLDMGFADELKRILALLPAERQTLLFSATFPRAVLALAATMLHDPFTIDVPDVASDSAAALAVQGAHIVQRAITVDTPARSLSFLLGRLPLTPPLLLGDSAAPLGGATSLGSKPAIVSRGTRWPWRFSISRKCASVAGVTKLTARPASPARPVRPMRCTWSSAERGRS